MQLVSWHCFALSLSLSLPSPPYFLIVYRSLQVQLTLSDVLTELIYKSPFTLTSTDVSMCSCPLEKFIHLFIQIHSSAQDLLFFFYGLLNGR